MPTSEVLTVGSPSLVTVLGDGDDGISSTVSPPTPQKNLVGNFLEVHLHMFL